MNEPAHPTKIEIDEILPETWKVTSLYSDGSSRTHELHLMTEAVSMSDDVKGGLSMYWPDGEQYHIYYFTNFNGSVTRTKTQAVLAIF